MYKSTVHSLRASKSSRARDKTARVKQTDQQKPPSQIIPSFSTTLVQYRARHQSDREEKRINKKSTKQKYRETVVNEGEKKKKDALMSSASKIFALPTGSLEPLPRVALLD